MLHATFGLTFPKQWGFENLTPSSGMLSATTTATNSAEIGSELPKTAKICQNQPKDETLKFQQESRSEWFSKINICKCRRDIGACLHRSDLQSYNFSYVFFLLEVASVFEFQHTPLGKKNLFCNLPRL
jgi:hypothetical protein